MLIIRFIKVKISYFLSKCYLRTIYISKSRYLSVFSFSKSCFFRREGIYNTVHDLTCWDCPETMRKKMEWYFKLSIGNAFRVSDGIIIISKFTKDRIIDKFHFDESKLIIAYCALSTVFLAYAELQKKDKMTLETIKNKVCQKYQLPKLYFLCLTTLEPRKTFHFLLMSIWSCFYRRR